MILCPNCSADMHFSPEKQMLVCNHCDAEVSPKDYSNKNGLEAGDSRFFETTVFTCPQCGGELMSTEETAATFCSYCGSSVVLTSRMSKEKRPKKIIPFKIGMDACKDSYRKYVKRAIYAPSYMKNESDLQKFRGIYMPYWSYTAGVDQTITNEAKESHREGNYIIDKFYRLKADCNGQYEGISYDASSSFSDNLSEGIAPFDIKDFTDFNPAYMSGFYADTGDVDSSIYEDDVKTAIKTHVAVNLNKTETYKEFSVSNSDIEKEVNPKIESADYMMYPVWFLSNRYGKERICYSVINGQTGKIAADLPIDPIKYLCGSTVIAVGLFVLFNFVLTLRPVVAMIIALILNLISIFISVCQISDLNKKETGEDDKGVTSINAVAMNQKVVAEGKDIASDNNDKSKEKKNNLPKNAGKIVFVQVVMLVIGIIIVIANPVSDLFYYAACAVVMITVALSFIDIIKQHNLLTTRKLPQLGARGGDEHADQD